MALSREDLGSLTSRKLVILELYSRPCFNHSLPLQYVWKKDTCHGSAQFDYFATVTSLSAQIL